MPTARCDDAKNERKPSEMGCCTILNGKKCDRSRVPFWLKATSWVVQPACLRLTKKNNGIFFLLVFVHLGRAAICAVFMLATRMLGHAVNRSWTEYKIHWPSVRGYGSVDGWMFLACTTKWTTACVSAWYGFGFPKHRKALQFLIDTRIGHCNRQSIEWYGYGYSAQLGLHFILIYVDCLWYITRSVRNLELRIFQHFPVTRSGHLTLRQLFSYNFAVYILDGWQSFPSK